MNLMQLASDFGGNIPTKCRTDYSRTQKIKARLVIPQHECKVLRDIVKKNFKWWLRPDILLGVEDAIPQYSLIH